MPRNHAARFQLSRATLAVATTGLAIATALTWPGPAASAAPDWDGDGATTTDCQPLDPAVHPAAVDHPDLSFEDLNCDGIDGDRANAYFVAPSGDDTANPGTSAFPFRTIQKAITTAAGSPTKAIYVATGTYNEHLTLGTAADGIRLHGGYQAGTWQRTTAATTTVNGQPEAMFLDGATDVLLQLVSLGGTRGAGTSAYGLRAVNASEVALIRGNATAGPGAPGATAGAGSTPIKAADGDPGDPGPSDCNVAGAGGVTSQPGNGTDGGAGGTGGEETNDGEDGQPGIKGGGTGGGTAGTAGVDIAGDAHGPNDGMHGGTGGIGGSGPAGAGGNGGANDFGAAGPAWAGRNGTGGGTGGAGFGGGGGGGGAGRGNIFDWGAGAGGGQGGDGGAGGSGGGGGGGGGGSFGVYLHNSAGTVVDGSTLQAGAGGAGGAGGTGGAGGAGGNGGAGATGRATCGITVGSGGAGGPGGQGGTGGEGGGGSGGPSLALIRLGSSVATRRASTLQHSTAGTGGTGGGSAGQTGEVVPAGGPDTDFDGDAITDAADSCVEIPRGTDGNGDGCPDRAAALGDGDGDGVPNGSDACPGTPAGSPDANSDGCPDSAGGGPPGGSQGGGAGSTGGGPLVTSPVGSVPDRLAPTLSAVAGRQRALRARRLSFAVRCNEGCRLTVKAMLGRRKLGGTLARRLSGGARAKLELKLSKTGLRMLRKALARRRSVTVTLKLAASDAAGNRRSMTKKLKAGP